MSSVQLGYYQQCGGEDVREAHYCIYIFANIYLKKIEAWRKVADIVGVSGELSHFIDC